MNFDWFGLGFKKIGNFIEFNHFIVCYILDSVLVFNASTIKRSCSQIDKTKVTLIIAQLQCVLGLSNQTIFDINHKYNFLPFQFQNITLPYIKIDINY